MNGKDMWNNHRGSNNTSMGTTFDGHHQLATIFFMIFMMLIPNQSRHILSSSFSQLASLKWDSDKDKLWSAIKALVIVVYAFGLLKWLSSSPKWDGIAYLKV